jgi:hypothetical protein
MKPLPGALTQGRLLPANRFSGYPRTKVSIRGRFVAALPPMMSSVH